MEQRELLEYLDRTLSYNVDRNVRRECLKIKVLRQSAANLRIGAGSETMHAASHVDGDIVQTTTSKDGHGDME